MPQTIDFVHCASGPEALEVPLTHADPFTALRYHFGMLLGVSDFEAQQAYHRGKTRLHNAWLHGAGVVWGLGVDVDLQRREVRVDRGLALGHAGHELYLDNRACVDIGAWLERNKDNPELEKENAVLARAVREGANGEFILTVHVVAYLRACLTREVPALAEPCEGTNTDTAFSRVAETMRLELRPGRPSAATSPGLEHARILMGKAEPRKDAQGVDIPSHKEIADARAALAQMPPADRAAAQAAALHRAGVLDTAALLPGLEPDGDRLLYPADERAPVVLATIEGMTLRKDLGVWTVREKPVITTAERISLLSTRVLQQWLQTITTVPLDAGGPRLTMQAPAAAAVTLVSDKPLSEPTVVNVNGQPFSLSSRTAATGWTVHQVTAALAADKKTITLTVGGGAALAAGEMVRVIARGTGPQPILGEDGIPLAGAVGDPPASGQNGRDFVAMQARS